MKVRLYARATKYDHKGWSYIFIEDRGDDVEYWEDEQEDYVFLGHMAFPDPKTSQLVKIGMACVEEMKKERAEEMVRTERVIREYEAKFLMLEVVEVEERS